MLVDSGVQGELGCGNATGRATHAMGHRAGSLAREGIARGRSRGDIRTGSGTTVIDPHHPRTMAVDTYG